MQGSHTDDRFTTGLRVFSLFSVAVCSLLFHFFPAKIDGVQVEVMFSVVRLRHIPRPQMSVCVLGDQQHCDEASANSVPCMDAEALKKLNKNKKLIKKLGMTACLVQFACYFCIFEALALSIIVQTSGRKCIQ